jgi:hypothetical protein
MQHGLNHRPTQKAGARSGFFMASAKASHISHTPLTPARRHRTYPLPGNIQADSTGGALPVSRAFATKPATFVHPVAGYHNVTAVPDRHLLATETPRYLSRGRAANADVRLVEFNGVRWVVKDFSACPWWIRQTLGRWMVSRELEALQRLDRIAGIPANASRIDAFAFADRFVDGKPLAQIWADGLTPDFFLAWERVVEQMHERGLAHLDMRNSGNVLMDEQGQPILIDYQSWMPLPRWWPALARYLMKIDLSGVYKLWRNRLPESLDTRRANILDSVNSWRKGWVFSNYLGLRRFFRERD